MSEEIKRRVVLASVLKPVDDTRMFEKIGPSLVAQGFEVFIIGYPSAGYAPVAGITVLPLLKFSRISFKRLLIPWIVLKKVNQVKPQIVIINTPELLFVMALGKLFSGRKIIYDVLENYYRNIRHTNTYPRLIKSLLAVFVRFTEIVFAPFVDRFLLAEKGYAKELKFAKNPVVLENKLPKRIAEKYTPDHSPYYNLLFSGTLAPTTGIFEAIKLAKELHALNSNYSLTIIGYAVVPEVLVKIKQEIADTTFIKLIGGDRLVPHHEILSHISKAGTGIIIYPANPGTESSIPTKLYEYLALKLPVVISHTQDSTHLVQRSNSGIVLTKDLNAAVLNERLANSSFTFDCKDEIFWEREEKKLEEALK